mmetsp:Transcript_5193/g.9732  ORF Transcript_5193/g.9732 Transcript_5193/m.9732 type:complete len:273 (+) Transcript_5193:1765-2583(+)
MKLSFSAFLFLTSLGGASSQTDCRVMFQNATISCSSSDAKCSLEGSFPNTGAGTYTVFGDGGVSVTGNPGELTCSKSDCILDCCDSSCEISDYVPSSATEGIEVPEPGTPVVLPEEDILDDDIYPNFAWEDVDTEEVVMELDDFETESEEALGDNGVIDSDTCSGSFTYLQITCVGAGTSARNLCSVEKSLVGSGTIVDRDTFQSINDISTQQHSCGVGASSSCTYNCCNRDLSGCQVIADGKTLADDIAAGSKANIILSVSALAFAIVLII